MTLPSGILTLLFTDIEGSTQLLDRLGDARYADLLTTHHAIVRAVLAGHAGHEVNTEGDAFFAVFERPPDAVAGAAEVQRRLARQEWPDGEAVRVRMGMATGTPMLAGADYLGMVVHVAARVCAAAHGGQVLLSATTAAALRARLPDGVSLRDLGEHALKDIAAPERLHQLVLDGLPDRFAPLRGQREAPTNIAPADAPLIGRDAELAAVAAALRDARLVTLTGPGGSGKTALALEAARRLRGELPGGAFFVDLVPVLDAAGILAVAADALGVAEAGEDAVFEALRDRPALLVLDNLEQIDGAGAPIASLLAACPRLKVLATSRAPLRLRAERELRVPPLAGAAAVELFVERARAVVPELEAGPTVEQICVRLDGLPLAIELAAARVRVLPPPTLLERLERRLPLLTSRALDVPERQRTLEATIAWSHDLLAPSERRLFATLGAFPGAWTFDAVAAAWGDEHELDVLDGLESLVEKSLLQPPRPDEPVPRYAMLETVREFARARLEESGEEDAVRWRLAEYHASLLDGAAVRMFHEGPDEWMPRLDAELDAIRATMALTGAGEQRLVIAGELLEYMESRGELTQARKWALDALASTPRAPSPARTLALLAACYFGFVQGELDASSASELEWTAERIDDAFLRALALNMVGMVAIGDDDGRAEWFMRRAADEARGKSDIALAIVLNTLANLALDAGRLAEARDLLEEGLACCGPSRTLFRQALTHTLAELVLAQGAEDEAERGFRELLSLTAASEVTTRIYGLEGLAWCRAAQDRPHEAARLLGAAQAHCERTGMVLMGFEADMRERATAAARDALGAGRFDALWHEGRELPLDDALAYALGTRTAPALAASL